MVLHGLGVLGIDMILNIYPFSKDKKIMRTDLWLDAIGGGDVPVDSEMPMMSISKLVSSVFRNCS